MRYTFEEIKRSIPVKGTCLHCGKKRTRTVSIMNTVNPFNKNPDGTVRTYEKVRAVVNAKAEVEAQELSDHFICRTCEDNREVAS